MFKYPLCNTQAAYGQHKASYPISCGGYLTWPCNAQFYGCLLYTSMLDATPEAVTYDLDQAAGLSENDAAAAEDRQASTSPKIIYTANLTLESKDYDTARAALDAACLLYTSNSS